MTKQTTIKQISDAYVKHRATLKIAEAIEATANEFKLSFADVEQLLGFSGPNKMGNYWNQKGKM